LQPAAVRAGLTALVYLVEPTNRPALGLLRSLGVELAFRDGLVQGRQQLPRQPMIDAERLGSGIVCGEATPLSPADPGLPAVPQARMPTGRPPAGETRPTGSADGLAGRSPRDD
jgi:hypothetical protein